MPNPESTETPSSRSQYRQFKALKKLQDRSLGLATAILLLFSLACGNGTDQVDDDSPASSAESSWADELPAKTVETTSDHQWFWAAIPDGAGAQISLVQSSDDGAGWQDGLGRPVEVPSALVHPFASLDEAVTADVPQLVYVAGQGLVAGSCSGAGEERSCRIDWNGETVAQGPQVSVASMEASPWRIYGDAAMGGLEMRGLEIAREQETVWLLNAGGQVEKHSQDSVRTQDLRTDWKAGDAVAAFDWANGFRRGEVAGVLEEQLRFLVRLEDGSQESYFFDRLTSPAG